MATLNSRTATADCTADVTLSADTEADATGVSITLGAGTWQIFGQLTLSCSSGSTYGLMHICDSSNVAYSSVRAGVAFAGGPQTLFGMAQVTPGGSTTYKLRGQQGSTGGTIKILRYGDGTIIGTRIWAMQIL